MEEWRGSAELPGDTVYGAPRLRNFRDLSRRLIQGENVEWVLGFIGDSWVRGSGRPGTHAEARTEEHTEAHTAPTPGDPAPARYFMPALSASLQRRYGDAGGGWCGLSYATSDERRGGSANSNRLYQEGTGSWVTHTNNRPTPDLCTSVSDVPGDSIRVTNAVGPTSAVSLHYLPGGRIDYRWNGGPWTRLELKHEARPCIAALTGFPRQGGWVLELRVVSGPVELAGIDHRSGTSGIRIHNFGAGGSTARHWTDVDAATWRNAFASFGCHTVLTLFGTNDQKHLTPRVHRQCLEQLTREIRLAAPEADIGLGTSPESGDSAEPRRSRPMHLYRAQARSLAESAALCHIDLQPAFGDVAQYRYSGSRPLMDESLIHPSVEGSRVIEALYSNILSLRVPESGIPDSPGASLSCG
jgi:hypothetical protein